MVLGSIAEIIVIFILSLNILNAMYLITYLKNENLCEPYIEHQLLFPSFTCHNVTVTATCLLIHNLRQFIPTKGSER